MHILLTEAHFGDSDRLARRLRELGVRVSACHERTGFCRAVRLGDRCPLDDPAGRVDLVVDVRRGGDELTAREYGVICAERARRPAWIVGDTPGGPATVPAAVRNTAIPSTEDELVRKCRRELGIGSPTRP